MSSLLRIFPDADFGTAFMNVTLLNLLKGATCEQNIIQSQLKKVKVVPPNWWERQRMRPVLEYLTELENHGYVQRMSIFMMKSEIANSYKTLFQCTIRTITPWFWSEHTWPEINVFTSSSVSELLGERTTYAIGTSPASASGYLQEGHKSISILRTQE